MAHLGIVTSRSKPDPLITLADVLKATEDVPRWALVFKMSYESLNVFYESSEREGAREGERERERQRKRERERERERVVYLFRQRQPHMLCSVEFL